MTGCGATTAGTGVASPATSIGALLAGAGIEAREARLLLSIATGMTPAILTAFPEREIEAAAALRFQAMAQRRAIGEPVAYILGYREFYSREFRVTPDVLIPRPETELLVELALERLPRENVSPAVLDLGTGSGAVAVTIACEAPQARVTAVDISPGALAVASENGARLSPRPLRFVLSDWFAALGDECYALIAGNPPYIAQEDSHLSQGDLRFEPRSALASGVAGLDAIRHVAATAPRHLEPGAWLLLEHGYDQGPACREILAQAGLRDVQTWTDLAGLDRVTGGHAAP